LALYSNTTGDYNTASSADALYSNTTGTDNTASGFLALEANTVGSFNTASGTYALLSNATGNDNTASGAGALYLNATGDYNTASGFQALYSNATGNNNTASGVNALYDNTTGSQNTASGKGAMQSSTSGSNNIAEGFQAGYNLTTGDDNIDIGNKGVAAESNTIRIGTSPTQNATYVAGVATAKVTGSAVYVTSTGQLGVLASSERFKTAIAPMGSDTTKLEQLRPVSFKLKSDATGTRQYGLIAEEVAKVYPELVIRDQNGRIVGVRYEELAPMLLNEMKKRNAAQEAEMRDLKLQVAELKTLNQATQLALRKLQAKDDFVAQQ
jgi:hypothetical protein